MIVLSSSRANSTKYFKSIERVGNELGFRQKLPRKRDSLISEVTPPMSPAPTSGLKLTVPQFDVSRSASPVLEPMSARLSDEDVVKTLLPMEALEDSPTTRMSARVLG
jgi:glucosamine-6-phosphate deaminase